jgi:hypothetical protein
MDEEKNKVVREGHKYDIETMIVTAWGNRFAYWRFDVTSVPDEIKLYALKGFIDDLQDCTTSLKRKDYPKGEKGDENYRLDCLAKRRELEKHINAGTRPARTNLSPETAEAKENKVLGQSMKKVAGEVSLMGLMSKKLLHELDSKNLWTEEDEAKLMELFQAKQDLEKGKGKR